MAKYLRRDLYCRLDVRRLSTVGSLFVSNIGLNLTSEPMLDYAPPDHTLEESVHDGPGLSLPRLEDHAAVEFQYKNYGCKPYPAFVGQHTQQRPKAERRNLLAVACSFS